MTSTLLFPEMAPPPMLAFPEPLCERYRPRRIAEFAGLAEPKRILKGFALYLDGTQTIPDTVWVFTCNATDRLAERFLSRNRVLTFSTYAIQAEAAAHLESVWTAEAPVEATRPNFARIIKDSNGNVREALAELEMRLDAHRAA